MYKLAHTNYKRNELMFFAEHLYDRKNFSDKWFYFTPDKADERNYRMSNWRRAKLLLGFVTAIAAGYLCAYTLSDSEDFRQYIGEMVVEEQVFDSLVNHKKPVFLTYYLPGDFHSSEYMKEAARAAKMYGDRVTFLHLNIKNSIGYMKHKDIDSWRPGSDLIFPYDDEPDEPELDLANAPFLQKMMQDRNLSEDELKGQLRKPSSKDRKFMTVSMGVRDRSVEGIESLFIEYYLINARQDPDLIVRKNLEHSRLVE